MAWPASTNTLEIALRQVNERALIAKDVLQSASDASASGPVRRQRIISALGAIARLDDAITSAQSFGVDMRDYARSQMADQGIDVVAEFIAMRNAGNDLAIWIDANMPRSGGGVVLDEYNARGEPTALTFTSTQLANFRTQVAVFAATIA